MTRLLLTAILFILSFRSQAQYIETIVNRGDTLYSTTGDGGPAVNAMTGTINAVTCDAAGNLYLYDYTFKNIRKVNASGIITAFAGKYSMGSDADGIPATDANIRSVSSMFCDAAGDLIFAVGDRIRKVTSDGLIWTIAGGGPATATADGLVATAARLMPLYSITTDDTGNIYCSLGNNVKKISAATNTVSTVINIPNTSLAFYDHTLYIARGTFGDRIYTIDASGTLGNYAGWGIDTADGAPADSSLIRTTGIAFDDHGTLYLGGYSYNLIRKINRAGIMYTVAGNGTEGYSGDGGPPRSAQLKEVNDICIDPQGNVIVAANHCVRKIHIDRTGIDDRAVTSKRIQIYPNPNKGSFNMLIPSERDEPDIKLIVCDVLGRKVDERIVNANRLIFLDIKQPPGLYYLSASTSTNKWAATVEVR